MTDLEKAVAKWLPEVWTPGQKCNKPWFLCKWEYRKNEEGQTEVYHEDGHDIRCPDPTRDLAMRIQEAAKINVYWRSYLKRWSADAGISAYLDVDLPTAIVKAAAALADKGIA